MTHGFRKARDTLKAVTTAGIDQRSALAWSLRSLKAGIRGELGELTPRQELLLESACQKWILAGRIAAWLNEQEALVVDGKVLSVTANYLEVVGSLERTLEKLGMRDG